MCWWLAGVLLGLVARLAQGEGQVFVLDHMLDLSLHGDTEQRDEVHDKDWPENRDVKHLEECAEEGHQS